MHLYGLRRSRLFDHNADFVVQLCEEDYRQSCDIFNQMYSIFTEKGRTGRCGFI